MRSYRIWFLFVLVVAALTFSSAHVRAAPQETISISPFLQSVTLMGSDVDKSFEIELTNSTKVAQTIKLSAVDFGSLEDTGGILFSGENAQKLSRKYGLTRWLHFTDDVIEIDAGKSAEATVTIINDINLSPGGHYAAVIANVLSADAIGGGVLNLKQKLTSLVFLTKTGGEKYDLHLDSVQYSSSLFGLPKDAILRFTNPGNVQVVPRGMVELHDPAGNLVSKGVINTGSNMVLPELSRKIPVELKSQGRTSWLPGIYNLKVAYRYDGFENYAIETDAFIYLPWGLFLILVLVASSVVFLLVKFPSKMRLKPRKNS